MNELKKGDMVRCVDNNQLCKYITIGKEYKVMKANKLYFFVVNDQGAESNYFQYRFTKAYPNEPHVHCEKIKAWADGARIKETAPNGKTRIYDTYCIAPEWYESWTYKIVEPKPTQLEKLRAEVDRLSERIKDLEDE